MGKCYHCDFCDRYFKDAPAARKKHLDSIPHKKNKAEHYNRCKDPETLLHDESKKRKCNKFPIGQCPYDYMCTYSHYSLEQMHQLQMIVAAKKQPNIVYPDPEKIIKDYFEDIVDPDEVDPDTPLFPIHSIAKDIPNLPPSLQPITLRNFKTMKLAEWGKQ